MLFLPQPDPTLLFLLEVSSLNLVLNLFPLLLQEFLCGDGKLIQRLHQPVAVDEVGQLWDLVNQGFNLLIMCPGRFRRKRMTWRKRSISFNTSYSWGLPSSAVKHHVCVNPENDEISCRSSSIHLMRWLVRVLMKAVRAPTASLRSGSRRRECTSKRCLWRKQDPCRSPAPPDANIPHPMEPAMFRKWLLWIPSTAFNGNALATWKSSTREMLRYFEVLGTWAFVFRF